MLLVEYIDNNLFKVLEMVRQYVVQIIGNSHLIISDNTDYPVDISVVIFTDIYAFAGTDGKAGTFDENKFVALIECFCFNLLDNRCII